MSSLRSTPDRNHSVIAELYERYWLTILIYVRQRTSSLEDAEDVLLEVFVAALESDTFFTLQEKQQLAWLRTTAHHKSVDHHRQSARHPAVPLLSATETLFEEDARAPEQMVISREERMLLQGYLLTLSESQQEVLRLRFAEGLPCAEIAKHMNKSEVATRSLLSRTLNLLRRIYEKSKEEIYHG